MFSFLLLLASGAEPTLIEPGSQSAAVTWESEQGVLLWQTLRAGMTADQTAAALRLIEGVKSVTLKPSRKGPNLSISYGPNGVQVGGLPYKVVLEFKNDRLVSVGLQSEACLSLATAKFHELGDLLSQKYGEGRTAREVTEDRQYVATRNTFATTPTRVVLRVEPGDIPRHVYGGRGIAGALASIGNSMADAEIAACPSDAGQRASIAVTYLDNASSTAKDATDAAESAAHRERDKSKL